jgi:HPt (histidine-containing phosphotransfer) domain-containing protein
MAFAEENTSTLDKIKNCLSENDYASAADLFHKVKSSAGSIGSESVRILAGTLQNLCNEEDSDGIQEGMRRFEPALSRLLEMIHEESGR